MTPEQEAESLSQRDDYDWHDDEVACIHCGSYGAPHDRTCREGLDE